MQRKLTTGRFLALCLSFVMVLALAACQAGVSSNPALPTSPPGARGDFFPRHSSGNAPFYLDGGRAYRRSRLHRRCL